MPGCLGGRKALLPFARFCQLVKKFFSSILSLLKFLFSINLKLGNQWPRSKKNSADVTDDEKVEVLWFDFKFDSICARPGTVVHLLTSTWRSHVRSSCFFLKTLYSNWDTSATNTQDKPKTFQDISRRNVQQSFTPKLTQTLSNGDSTRKNPCWQGIQIQDLLYIMLHKACLKLCAIRATEVSLYLWIGWWLTPFKN